MEEKKVEEKKIGLGERFRLGKDRIIREMVPSDLWKTFDETKDTMKKSMAGMEIQTELMRQNVINSEKIIVLLEKINKKIGG